MSRERYLGIRYFMLPKDTNSQGTIFGGVILSNIDQAGAIGAVQHVRANGWKKRSFMTVAMKEVIFLEPVLVGDLVSFWTEIKKIGTTSITMSIYVDVERDGKNNSSRYCGSSLCRC